LDRDGLVDHVVRRLYRVVGVDQLVEVGIRRVNRRQVVVVEIDLDLRGPLGQNPAGGPIDRLRHDAQDLRTEIQLELPGVVLPVVLAVVRVVAQSKTVLAAQRSRSRAGDVDAVQVVRQVFGEAENHFAGRVAQPDIARFDHHVVRPAQNQGRVIDHRRSQPDLGVRIAHGIGGDGQGAGLGGRVEDADQLGGRGLVARIRVQVDLNRPAVHHLDDRTARAAVIALGHLDAEPVARGARRDGRERDVQVATGIEVRGNRRLIAARQAHGRVRHRRRGDIGRGGARHQHRLHQFPRRRVLIDRVDQAGSRGRVLRRRVQFDENGPPLDADGRRRRPAHVAFAEQQRHAVARLTRSLGLEFDDHLPRRVEIRPRRRDVELEITAAPRDPDRVQRRVVDYRLLVKMKHQLARSDVSNVAVLEQISLVRLDADKLRARRHHSTVLQRFDPQALPGTLAPLLLTLFERPSRPRRRLAKTTNGHTNLVSFNRLGPSHPREQKLISGSLPGRKTETLADADNAPSLYVKSGQLDVNMRNIGNMRR